MVTSSVSEREIDLLRCRVMLHGLVETRREVEALDVSAPNRKFDFYLSGYPCTLSLSIDGSVAIGLNIQAVTRKSASLQMATGHVQLEFMPAGYEKIYFQANRDGWHDDHSRITVRFSDKLELLEPLVPA